jgi:hypothetical protein
MKIIKIVKMSVSSAATQIECQNAPHELTRPVAVNNRLMFETAIHGRTIRDGAWMRATNSLELNGLVM